MWIAGIERLKSYLSITNELKSSDNTIVLVGNDKEAQKLDGFLRKHCNYWGIAKFNEGDKGREYTELAFENIEDYIVVFSDGDMVRNHEEKLIDIGFKSSQFRRHFCDGVGSRLNYYDYLIGYTKKSRDNLPGYVFFPPSANVEPQEGDFTILTLGGSTTDPTTGNLISWSEYLYNDLKKYCDNVRLICAGVNSHVASQELFKLIRDGYLFSPDLVISYSGVNDFSDHYQDNTNPFVLCYTKRILPQVIKKRILNEKDVMHSDRMRFWDSFYGAIVKEYSLGVDAPKPVSRADHWIRCEKMMYSVSQSIGAKFIGILQPQNFADTEDPKVMIRNSNYEEAKQKVHELNYNWLLDFTQIFDGKDDIFYDNCHVYGRGNKLIAKKILPYALNAIQEKQKEQSK